MHTSRLRAYGATHTGRERASNEDRCFCDPDRGVFIVVDGVGGYAAGEVAADLACDLVSRRLRQTAGPPAERLRAAITAANNEIFSRSRTNPAHCGMACVLTAAVVEDETVTVGHVGDTRLYVVRREGIRKITRDHSPVGAREDAGELSEMEAMNHPRRSEILRDVGSALHDPDDDDFIDIYQFAFAPDSALLLCSDGLTDLVPGRPIHQVMLDHAGQPEQGVETLIELANELGGEDNITALIVEGAAFETGPPEEASSGPSATPASFRVPPAAGERRGRRPVLRGRPAVFVYGWLAGCLLSVIPLLMGYHILESRLPAVAPEQPARLARTLRVAPAGAGAYSTIAEALAYARPGDVVEVEPGVYREGVRLKDSVAVVSRVPGAAVIRVPGSAAGDSAAVTALGGRGARLAGFKVESAEAGSGRGIGLHLRDTDVEVVDVEVVGAGFAGALVEGVSAALLCAGAFTDNAGPGVYVRGAGARPRLVRNVIRRNGAARGAPGVLVEDEAAPVLIDNVITGNAGEGIRIREAPAASAGPLRARNFFRVEGEENGGQPVRTVVQ